MGQIVRRKEEWTVVGCDGEIVEIKVERIGRSVFAKMGSEEGWRCFNDESGIEIWAKERF